MRKPVVGIYNQVRHKPVCTVTGKCWKLDYTICAAKTNALISCAVTDQLCSNCITDMHICFFLLNINHMFSHDGAHKFLVKL